MRVTVQQSPDEQAYFSPSDLFKVGVPYRFIDDSVICFSNPPNSMFEKCQTPTIWVPSYYLENFETGTKIRRPKKIDDFVTCSFLIDIVVNEYKLNSEFINEQGQLCSFRNECINKVSVPPFCYGNGMSFTQTLNINGESECIKVNIIPMANVPNEWVYARRSWFDQNNGTDVYHIRPSHYEDSGVYSPTYKSPLKFWEESGQYSLMGWGWRKSKNLQGEVREFLGLDPGFTFIKNPETYVRATRPFV